MEGYANVLESITLEQKLKAFEKAKNELSTKDKDNFVLITEPYYDAACDILRKSYVPDEPLSRSLNIDWSDEYEAMYLEMFNQNLSFLLLSPENNDVMACCVSGIKKQKDRFCSNFKDAALNKQSGFLEYSYGKVSFLEKYGVGEVFFIDILAVGEKYRKRGIAKQMIEAAIAFFSNLDIPSCCIKVAGTSNFSKKIFEQLGFDALIETPFTEYTVDDKLVLGNTGVHKSHIIYGKLISR